MTDRYAVFGNPVAHSLSPRIHAAFAKQFGDAIRYDKVLVEEGQFAEAARQFFGIAGESGEVSKGGKAGEGSQGGGSDKGGCGLNVTAPFKGEAFEFAENNPFGLAGQCSERAKLAKAVNTLWMEGGQVRGDNTDGVGLVRDLTGNLGWEIKNRQVLVIGAGGAVRGVMAPLLQQEPVRLVVINRTLKRFVDLVEQLMMAKLVEPSQLTELEETSNQAGQTANVGLYMLLEKIFGLSSSTLMDIDDNGMENGVCGILEYRQQEYKLHEYEPQEGGQQTGESSVYGLRGGASPKDRLSEHDLLRSSQFDLVINSTSVAASGDLPPLHPSLLTRDTGCYDMVYGKTTAFMQWAIDNGIGKVTDGLGMLVEQAAESFSIWRGMRPDTAPVLATIHNELAQGPTAMQGQETATELKPEMQGQEAAIESEQEKTATPEPELGPS